MTNPLIVVSMTSWKKRIQQVHITINQFMLEQTIRPNIFYLWLSEEEFPNKEKDLPLELLQCCKAFGVRITWLKDNEYVFKRWKVYPKHYDDYVITIDDDSFHSPTLIQDALDTLSSYKDEKVICNVWWQFSAVPHYDNDIKINFQYERNHISQTIWWCGTAIIPPKTFPLEMLSDEMIEFRKKHFPKNDEVMFNAYSIRDNIMKTFIARNYPYRAFANEHETAIATEQKAIDENGYKPLEKNLYLMLDKLNIVEKYKQLHPGYDPTKFLSL